ncbi:efflux RND transporter periplasmic adaptor subunit [Eremococcus coleocola]|uniref:efflux RND transporter periplasmic adaptor subunit n=1 Tax=Eremococcus coleocola TaxID=88132 RepID=UPI00041A2738|nr:biotin/lipoyl-binding protein [Eremococcus coleocola]
MFKLRKGVFIGLLVLLFLSGLGLAVKQVLLLVEDAEQSQSEADDRAAYMVYAVADQAPVTVNGTVQLAGDSAYFYDSNQGDIADIKVKDGQKVQRGDILFTYNNNGQDLKYELEDAQRENQRLIDQRQSLLNQLTELTGVYYNFKGDQIELDPNAKDGYYVVAEIGQSVSAPNSSAEAESEGLDDQDGGESVKEQIRQLNQQIDDATIKIERLKEKQSSSVKAQADGKVYLDLNGQTDSSLPLVRIVSEDIVVRGQVDEFDFYVLAEDRPVTIYLPAEDRTVKGSIISYEDIPAYSGTNASSSQQEGLNTNPSPSSSNAESAKFAFVVKPETKLQAGFSAKVNIKLPGYVIPAEAILDQAGKTYVFIYQDGRAFKKEIKLEQEAGQDIIKRGLKAGEQVILNPIDLSDGQTVDIIDNQNIEAPLSAEGSQ